MREIDELNPGVVLLITGGWVDAPRLSSIAAMPRRNATFVKHSSTKDGRKWLVMERPEYKHQQPIVEEITRALGELS
jgi:hypothetical protein